MKRLALILALAGVLLGGAGLTGYWYGRYRTPPRVEQRVEYKERVEYRDRVVLQRVEGPVRVRTVTRTTPGPRGPERVVVREVERGPVLTQVTGSSSTSAISAANAVAVKERPVEPPRWLVGATIGLRLDARPAYGGQVLYRIVGPAWLGVAADTRGEVRGQLAVSF